MKSTAQKMFVGFLAVGGLALLFTDGCGGPPPEENVFHVVEPERVLHVCIDLSGSFDEFMMKDGKAWKLLMKAVDKYLRANSDDKIIISQVSGNTRSLVLDCTPAELQRQFPNPEAFRTFLLSKADRDYSRLYDGISESIQYVLDMPGVQSGKTKTVLLVFSDMDDNKSGPGGAERLAALLKEYGAKGGAVGFYFVVDYGRWRIVMKSAGLKDFVCSPPEDINPTLPTFN